MEKTLGERIKIARMAASLSQQAMAEAMNQLGGKSISRTAIAQWESGLTKEIEASNLLRASKILEVTPEWLQFGHNGHSDKSEKPDQPTAVSKSRKILWLSNAQVINFMDNINKIPQVEILNLGLDDELAKIAGPSTFAISIKDDSMSPILKINDIIVIDPAVTPNPGEIIAVKIVYKNEIVIRKYRPSDHSKDNTTTFELIPSNKNWPTITINNVSEGHILGTLIEHRCRRRTK